jgi:hypothetical protein
VVDITLASLCFIYPALLLYSCLDVKGTNQANKTTVVHCMSVCMSPLSTTGNRGVPLNRKGIGRPFRVEPIKVLSLAGASLTAVVEHFGKQ